MECQCIRPQLLDYTELTRKQRRLYNRYLEAYPMRNSEMSFNSIYIWKDNWPLWLSENNGSLFMQRRYTHRTPCFWPVLGPDNRLRENLCLLLEEAERDDWPFEMRGVTEEYREKMEIALPGVFDFDYDRNFSDYIYKAEDLRNLGGKKYHAKRNHVNRFVEEHPDYVFRRASVADMPRCEQILTDSLVAMEQTARLDEEIALMHRTFMIADEKQMDFAVLEIDGEIQGYTAGEMQFGDTALIHLEVANRDIRGTYPVINRDFLRNFYPDVTWVNREEDVGVEGLRKAKLSYNPDHLLNKYTVYRKGGKREDGTYSAN